jgi:IMP cyclohydrolase
MELQNINTLLNTSPYPGRGILLGRSSDGEKYVIAYFIMGRSENSRNRVFEQTPDGIRTRAFDESKMTDPSLIIYHPVRQIEGGFIVTNGDQTDTIRDYIADGKSFTEALRTRRFEPDPPLYTPRVSGFLARDGSAALSILKSSDGNPDFDLRFFYEYSGIPAGEGRLIHTYDGAQEPSSFEGEPRRVEISTPDAKTLAGELWDSLNNNNKVSLYVNYVDLTTGEGETVIINKNV